MNKRERLNMVQVRLWVETEGVFIQSVSISATNSQSQISHLTLRIGRRGLDRLKNVVR